MARHKWILAPDRGGEGVKAIFEGGRMGRFDQIGSYYLRN
jgi:hypothetical protein